MLRRAHGSVRTPNWQDPLYQAQTETILTAANSNKWPEIKKWDYLVISRINFCFLSGNILPL